MQPLRQPLTRESPLPRRPTPALLIILINITTQLPRTQPQRAQTHRPLAQTIVAREVRLREPRTQPRRLRDEERDERAQAEVAEGRDLEDVVEAQEGRGEGEAEVKEFGAEGGFAADQGGGGGQGEVVRGVGGGILEGGEEVADVAGVGLVFGLGMAGAGQGWVTLER